jgi:hypothetical protein
MQKAMNLFRPSSRKENKTLNLVFGILAVGILIMATYLTLSHHPLADRVSRWQGDAMNDKNKYFPVLTIFLLALPPLLLLLPIKLLFLKAGGKK